jgi:hypothetical protein
MHDKQWAEVMVWFNGSGDWRTGSKRSEGGMARRKKGRKDAHGSGSGARGFDADSWGAGYDGDVGRADRYAGD